MSSSHGITSGMFSSKAQLMCCHSATLTRCPSRSLTWPCETRGSKHQVKFAYTCYSHFHVPNVQHPSLTKTNVRTWHRMVSAQTCFEALSFFSTRKLATRSAGFCPSIYLEKVDEEVQHPRLTKTNVRAWHRVVPVQLTVANTGQSACLCSS